MLRRGIQYGSLILLAVVPCLAGDQAALLAAIQAHPDEDTPRLAYADWLDEYGGSSDRARAEFIRVQIEQFNLPAQDSGGGRARKRAEELLKKNWLEWTPLRLRGHVPVAAGRAIPYSAAGTPRTFWRRGFIEGIELAGGQPDEYSIIPALEGVPTLRSLALRGNRIFPAAEEGNVNDVGLVSDSTLQALYTAPFFRRLTEIDLLGSLQPLQWERFSRRLGTLAALKMNAAALIEESFVTLAGSSYAPTLQFLCIESRGSAAATRLFRSPHLRNLHTLVLQQMDSIEVTHDDWSALANPTNLPSLQHLRLDSPTTVQSLELIGNARFQTLIALTLNLYPWSETDDIFNALRTRMKNLRHLEILRFGKPDALPTQLQRQINENKTRLGCATLLQFFHPLKVEQRSL